MAGPQAGTIVAVKVFVEQDMVAPVRIALKLLRAAIDRSSSLLVATENGLQAGRNLLADPNKFIILPEPVGHSMRKLSP